MSFKHLNTINFWKAYLVSNKTVDLKEEPFLLQLVQLQCMDKSKLIQLLNKLATMQPHPQEYELLEDVMVTTPRPTSRKITLVDGMVPLQQMAKKPPTVFTVTDLSECFSDRLMPLARYYGENHPCV